MAKSRSQPTPVPQYRDALTAMRQQARDDVRHAIRDANRSIPQRVRKKANPGAECFALFSGIVDALAVEIVGRIDSGSEHIAAQVFCDMLIAKVARLSSLGTA